MIDNLGIKIQHKSLTMALFYRGEEIKIPEEVKSIVILAKWVNREI